MLPVSTILFVLLVVPLHLALEKNSQPFDLLQNYRPVLGHTVNPSINGSTGPQNHKISAISFVDDFTTPTTHIEGVAFALTTYEDFS